MIPFSSDAPRPCTDRGDLFIAPHHQPHTTNAYKRRVEMAKYLCSTCPIKLACRDEGRRLGAEGVWGGEDDVERKAAGIESGRRFRQLAPCGTTAAARRHRRKGEDLCSPCAQAESVHTQNQKAKKAPPECGTRAGYQRHLRNGETPDQKCRDANNAADRLLHTTGSTVATAA